MIRRTLVRVAVLGCVTLGVTALLAASPRPQSSPSAATFEVGPPLPVVACPGPQTVPVGDVGAGGDLASEPTERTLETLASVETFPVGIGVGAEADIAAQMERIGDGDIEGWAALTCSAPALDQWLVGGATSLGASARIVLTNPSGAPTEATVTVYGPLGVVETQYVTSVGAGSQSERLIEAFATDVASLVVRVTATGPGVVASLQDSRLEGFQPAGTEWVAPAPLASDLVIPAVGADDLDATVTLRLMAPEGALVTLTLVSDEGVEPWPVGRALELEPGVVTDIDVPADALGAIEIAADAPVVAAARTVVPREAREGIAGQVAYDQTWVNGQALVEASAASAVLTGVVPRAGSRVALYSPTDSTVSFATEAGDVVQEVSARAHTVTWVDIPVAAGTTLTTTGGVAWAFVVNSEDGYLTSASPILLVGGTLTATVIPAPYPADATAAVSQR